MSVTYRVEGEKALREAVAAFVDAGTDPRGYRKGLAQTYRVDLERVDAIIAELAPVGCEDRQRYEDYCNSAAGIRAAHSDPLDTAE